MAVPLVKGSIFARLGCGRTDAMVVLSSAAMTPIWRVNVVMRSK
jgi:hypothetical protein